VESAVPGSVQEASGCSTMRYSLVVCGSYGDGRTTALDDLVGPFQPCDCMILGFFAWFFFLLFTGLCLAYVSKCIQLFAIT